MKKFTKAFGAVALSGALLLGGCGSLKADSALISADGKDIVSVGVGNFAARYSQATMDTMFGAYMGNTYWNTASGDDEKTPADSTKEQTIDELKERYLAQTHAADYGVEISADDKTAITEAAKKFIEANDQEALDQIGATQEIVEEYLTGITYYSRVRDAFFEKTDVEVTDEEAIQSKISYVKFSLEGTETDEDGETVELTDEEKNIKKASAEIVSGSEDFDKAVTSEGETVQTYSYTASMDPSEDESMGEEVIAAAQALKEGEVSKVIETDDAYYVIRKDADNDEESTTSKRKSLTEEKKSDKFEEQMDEWKDAVKWKVNESQWKLVKFYSRFTQKAAESTDDSTESTESTEESSEESEEPTVEVTEDTED